jgi:hypothetical protein
MIDGTVPGWEQGQGDLHFDHHRIGGAEIQVDEVPIGLLYGRAGDKLFVTTQLDADACVAATWLQVNPEEIGTEDIRRLRAIAFDCDHLQVPPDLEDLADFAAQAVAAMKFFGFKLKEQMGLPQDPNVWAEAQKTAYSSAGFRQGVEWLLDAVEGNRPYPGEQGEAAEYWVQLEKDVQTLVNGNHILPYKSALLFLLMDFGRYVDPRAPLRAAKRLGLSATLTVTQRKTADGWSYTIASSNKDLISRNAFQRLTIAECLKRQVNVEIASQYWGFPQLSEKLGFDPWGGREAVGGSGWRSPSLLSPTEVVDVLFD